MKKTKYSLLKRGVLYDLIGVATHFIPVGGFFIDLFWAPYAAKKMTEMYSGRQGQIAAVIVFLEEILPLDLIPTFTLMWLYTYVFSGSKSHDKSFVEVSAS